MHSKFAASKENIKPTRPNVISLAEVKACREAYREFESYFNYAMASLSNPYDEDFSVYLELALNIPGISDREKRNGYLLMLIVEYKYSDLDNPLDAETRLKELAKLAGFTTDILSRLADLARTFKIEPYADFKESAKEIMDSPNIA